MTFSRRRFLAFLGLAPIAASPAMALFPARTFADDFEECYLFKAPHGDHWLDIFGDNELTIVYSTENGGTVQRLLHKWFPDERSLKVDG